MIAAHGHATGGDMKSTILLAGILCAMTATYARASSPYRGGLPGWGPRLGVTMDPDQVHFGVHLDAGSFADRFRFQPNVELGLSDELTVLAFNGEFAYRFNSDWGEWSPYLGGGLGINLYDDNRPMRHDRSRADLGASVLGGIETGIGGGDRFFMETKLGLVDSPDLKFGVGWTFY